LNSNSASSNWIAILEAGRVRTQQSMRDWESQQEMPEGIGRQWMHTINDRRTDGMVAISEVPDACLRWLIQQGISAFRIDTADSRPT
jgi:hypothetical protein